MKFSVSVVIPTKNAGHLFNEVMDALKKQDYECSYEIVIVDSGSSDETKTIASKSGARVLEIAPGDFNHGTTRDYGIQKSSGEIVVLITQDATPADRGLISSLVSAFDDPRVAGAYARQIPRPDADLITKRNLENWITGGSERKVRCLEGLDMYEKMAPMEKYLFCNFDNVCSAIRKEVWRSCKFGINDFGEDIDWSERVLKAGYKIVYEPAAAVIHSHDRPLSYEFKRTYLCHRKIYRQFGLRLVPTVRHILKSWIYVTKKDWLYIYRAKERLSNKIWLFCKIPILNVLSAFAQYSAVRDETRKVSRKVEGV